MSSEQAAERVRAKLKALRGISLDEALEMVRDSFAKATSNHAQVRGFSLVLSAEIEGRSAIYTDHQCWDRVLHFGAVCHHAHYLDRRISENSMPYSEGA